jgi:hypothetical protein
MQGLLASAMEVLLEVADVCNPNNKWEIWNQVRGCYPFFTECLMN